jgi:hypothetical protein
MQEDVLNSNKKLIVENERAFIEVSDQVKEKRDILPYL